MKKGSPLSDPEVLAETINIAKEEYGEKIASESYEKFTEEGYEKTLKEEDIIWKTDHLPNYEKIPEIIPLQGEEYNQMRKASYDLLISLAIPERLQILKIGEIKTDMRPHPMIILPSGKGKKEVREGIKSVSLAFNPEMNIKEPRSIHKEQLIGKVLKRKEKVNDGETNTGKIKYKVVEIYKKKYGFLKADLLILEEAYQIFNSNEKNDVDCRDCLLVAMDTYGENFISKQNIDNLDTEEETIGYYPIVKVLSFCQPMPMKEEFVIKGMARRQQICFKEFPNLTNNDHFINRLKAKPKNEESVLEFANYMKKINNIQTEWEFSSDAYDSFIICHQALLQQGFQQNNKIESYTKILEYPMQNLLLKTAGLRAISKLRTLITKTDVEEAFVDILERFVYELKYIDTKVRGLFDYGDGWGGASGKQQECLKWLWERGAKSKEESEIYIYGFQKRISEIFDISIRRARDRYNDMKKNGLIDDWLGQGKENRVWVAFEPKEEKTRYNIPNNINPHILYKKFSGRTSGRTLEKTEITHKTQEKQPGRTGRTRRTPKTRENILKQLVSINKKLNNDSLSVQPVQGVQPETKDLNPHVKPQISDQKQENHSVQPEISDRDIQYYDDPICKSIIPCSQEEVLRYKQTNPKTTIKQLIEKFGSGVMRLKKEGVI